MVKTSGLCAMHYQRNLRHGHTDDTRRHRQPCTIDGCDAPSIAKGLCRKHYYRVQRTGTTDDPETKAKPTCSMEGCDKPRVAHGYCQAHYKRFQRHSDVIQTRPSDWGTREGHPLYVCWSGLMRYRRAVTVARWHDLWNFVEDIGESRPSPDHILTRLDADGPYGPGNVYWKEPTQSRKDEDFKRRAREYMRTWRRVNLRKAADVELRKRYGITIDQYEDMDAAQGGVCAICGNEESRVDHWTKNISRLAVDHDHKTSNVRALLCHAHNVSLGGFGDDPMLLAKSIEYLARHSDDHAGILNEAIAYLTAARDALAQPVESRNACL
jgi:hypothetical protein